MKYKTVKKLWFAAAILTTTTSLWTNVNAMETPAASGAGVIRALNEQRILSEQYAIQQIQTGAGELAEGEAAGGAGIDDVAELSLGNAEEEMPAADEPELAVAIAPNYVNIRKEPSTEGEVLGKLYRNTVGVIDMDYCNADNEGHIMIKLVNRGDKVLNLKCGDRFAQGIIKSIMFTTDDDSDKYRTGGMGSTGK